MSNSRHRKPYPKGQRREISAEWLTRVREAMAARGVTGTGLAVHLGVHKTLISKMLAGKQQVSSLVDRISEFLAVENPMVSLSDTEKRILDLIQTVSRRNHYPDRPMKVVTASLKQRVRDRLRELGKPNTWLEQQLGTGNGSVRMFLTRAQTSTLVDPICEILDLHPDDTPSGLLEIIDIYNEATSEQRAVMEAFMRSVKAMQGSATKK